MHHNWWGWVAAFLVAAVVAAGLVRYGPRIARRLKPEPRIKHVALTSVEPSRTRPSPADVERPGGILFIHHSVGEDWLDHSLREALLAKPYITDVNDSDYGTVLEPDPGRPASLGPVPGDHTDMQHWILWFNDYLGAIKSHGCEEGTTNRIVMFKSCYPMSNVDSDGRLPGNPFSHKRTVTNYQAVYRPAGGPGNGYEFRGYTYRPLQDIFAANPDTLFIVVTAPPRHYAPKDAGSDAKNARARRFYNWLKTEWLPAYDAANPGLCNVAVFDLFDVLANPADAPAHPNRLRAEYGGESGDSHPNEAARAAATEAFASGEDNLLDRAWERFSAQQ